MNALVLSLLLAGCPEPATAALPQDSVAAFADQIRPDLQTGSLLFSKGDCLAVKVFTASPYTHVAVAVLKDGQPYVYDSMNGVGTRCLTLNDWLDSQRPDQVHVYNPREPFDAERSQQLQAALDGRLGKPYAIKHHLTGQRVEGMHCAEYATDALVDSHLIKVKNAPRVSPASLREALLRTELYESTRFVQLVAEEAPAEKGDNWGSQLWIDTKVCTVSCCIKLRRWFLCR